MHLNRGVETSSIHRKVSPAPGMTWNDFSSLPPFQMREQFENNMQNMRDYVKSVESNSAKNLDHEVTLLGKKISDQEQDFQSLSGLNDRMKDLETQIAKVMEVFWNNCKR